ncbi:uncharacterized protein BO88DRAFT_402091 [Aspergillus vadensis CBS 113365]|uniref:Transmembrane protein n=1 Tax=Aspergillus vadensis (strain CBS 113365 / IMI 142717 / IBT 24658) TaxID=1448311 RepID=A0A319CCL5_ASPVC|nr:hypothetical protein BO88DRAFT_402091 [Aspergillus vadensis CBS 113365]PYH73038.1 hypothetical protein BO88DRAFT_402091 [Aspergillus vadensis CBS 113365]
MLHLGKANDGLCMDVLIVILLGVSMKMNLTFLVYFSAWGVWSGRTLAAFEDRADWNNEDGSPGIIEGV